MTILFTGGGGISSEYIYRNINEEVFFADCEPDRIHPNIPKSRRKKIPYAEDNQYIKYLIDLIDEISCDYLIPAVDEELIAISRNRSKIPCEIILPDEKFVVLFLDKRDSANFLSQNNLGPPSIFEYDLKEKTQYILKPRFGRGSRGVCIVDSIEKYHSYLRLYGRNKSDVIIQPLIEGIEFTVTIVANKKGELINIYPIIAHNKKGSTVAATCSSNSFVLDFCRKFQKITKINYIYNIQMILDKNNNCHIFEINPRISTTFSMPLRHNKFILKDLLSNKENPLTNWSGTRLSRNYVSYVFERKSIQ